MEIEVGKFYRLRNGRKALVEYISRYDEPYIFRGVIFSTLNEADPAEWKADGASRSMWGDQYIVAEWDETKAPRVTEATVAINSFKDRSVWMRIYNTTPENYEILDKLESTVVRKIRYTEGGKIEDVTDE